MSDNVSALHVSDLSINVLHFHVTRIHKCKPQIVIQWPDMFRTGMKSSGGEWASIVKIRI